MAMAAECVANKSNRIDIIVIVIMIMITIIIIMIIIMLHSGIRTR